MLGAIAGDVIGSPALARDVLLAVQAGGGGGATVFAGRNNRYSVDEVLEAEDFLALVEGRTVGLAEAAIGAVAPCNECHAGVVENGLAVAV